MKKETPEIKTGQVKGGRVSTPLTPEELREMYVLVKEIHHQLGLGPRQRSTAEIRRIVEHNIARLQERQTRKEAERRGKKE